jgi:monofunctional biosynthetic peptidoglycan transglycosylase
VSRKARAKPGKGRRRIGWRWRIALGLPLLGVLASVALVLPWRWVAPPTSAFMLRDAAARRGSDAQPIAQRWIPWEQISPRLALAVLAAEDQKFLNHRGFDLVEIARAVEERRERPRGASTISQQVAKNLFLWPERSLVRKGAEAWLTLLIELLWPKRRILEVYLNVAEFGDGIYGASAASWLHFGVSPRVLSLEQACLLAAVLPSPRRMTASRPSEYVRTRAAEIEQVVQSLGGTAYLSRI